MSTLKTLSDLCRNLGISLVLDCVYNHIGDRHPFYRDHIRNSWFHLSDSFRRSNYRISALTDPYAAPSEQAVMREGWFDHHMPDLDQHDPVLARYLIQQTLWWVAQTGAGGVRIDTYPYSDQAFLLQLLERLKKAFPELFVFGETWEHIPTAQAAWTYNRMSDTQRIALDGVSDFQLAFALHRGLREPFGWNTGVSSIYYTLAGDGLYRHPENLVTFVDNHDLDRAAALYKNDLATLRIAYGILYSQRGIPCVFYGSELMMDGAGPHGVIREDFPGGWPGDSLNLFNQANLSVAQRDLHHWLRALAGIRAAYPRHFTEGRRMQYIPQDSTYACFIRHGDTVLGFFVNTGNSPRQVPVSRFPDWPLNWNNAEPLLPGTPKAATGVLTLPARSFSSLRFHLSGH
jgi:glycosidase